MIFIFKKNSVNQAKLIFHAFLIQLITNIMYRRHKSDCEKVSVSVSDGNIKPTPPPETNEVIYLLIG